MISRTVSQSTRKTINTLRDWLGQNPDHSLYDMTARDFVEQAAREDPAAAAEWAKAITDPSLAAEVSHFLIE